MNASDVAAWWGAGVATIVGAWEIWKSLHEGPRLNVYVGANRVIAGGGQIGPDYYIMTTVINRGTQATVITHHSGVLYRTWWDFRRKKNAQLFWITQNKFGHELPIRLEPGDQWQGWVDQGKFLSQYNGYRYLLLGVYDSMSEKPSQMRIDIRSMRAPGTPVT
jgi:hypothetical protein